METTLANLLPYLIDGIPTTIQVSVYSLLFGIPVSVLLALGRMSPWWIARLPAGFVIEMFRGTSALIQLFWAFYVLPFFGIRLSPMAAGVIVLGLNEGAYFSEVVRASLKTVMAGQRDAITSLQLPKLYAFFQITLPQALPLMIPPFGNAAVGMIKFSSLVSLVTLQDVTFRTHALQSQTGESLPVYLAALLIYFALALIAIVLVAQLERFVNRKAGRTLKSPARLFARRSNPIPKWAFGK